MRAWIGRAYRFGASHNIPCSRERLSQARLFTTFTQKEVHVTCGSAGSVAIDLINIDHYSRKAPLLIYLPPFSPIPSEDVHIPDVLQPWPVAVVRYRWANSEENADKELCLRWPTPIHDVSFAFSWLIEALAPEDTSRRDIYVYGSYLGAGLGASLGLTESHTHAKFGVRGMIGYNGIYNWTMFLPGHRINRAKSSARNAAASKSTRHALFEQLQDHIPDLFDKPADLFDPFASPSLFFHSPGVSIPSSFYTLPDYESDIETLIGHQTTSSTVPKHPRRSHLVFPPRKSTLKIPSTLLLHDTQDKPWIGKSRKSAQEGNSFKAQAEELAELMRRSLEKVEMKMRSQWDEDMEDSHFEIERRIQLVDVGTQAPGLVLNDTAEATIQEWVDATIPSPSELQSDTK